MFVLCFYVPQDFKEKVKTAVFKAGAGRVGNYDCCCFELNGLGQFRPLKGSDPFIGQAHQLEQVPEVRIELVCEQADLANVIKALKAAHPYETPVYHVTESLGY